MIDKSLPYVCPLCKSKLLLSNMIYSCQSCQKQYFIINNIPNFLIQSESERKIPTNISVLFDKIAKIYETKLAYLITYHFLAGLRIPSIKELTRKIMDRIDAHDGIILDLACGTGKFTKPLAKIATKVFGIDISQGMLEQFKKLIEKKGLTNIYLSKADAEKLPFSDCYFDAICCSGALHYFNNTYRALNEMIRVLKPNSPLVVMTLINRRFLKYKFVEEHLKEEHGGHIFKVKPLMRLLEKVGFKNISSEVYGSMLLFSAMKKI